VTAATGTGSSEQASVLPLFPLRTVLFPGGLLPLRIFEPRYIDMIGRCMREGVPFGVLCLIEGGESGAVAQLAEVGSSARIVDFEQLDDGLLGILCRGEQRFRLLQRHTQTDGLHVGEVRWLVDPPHTPLKDARRPLGNVLRKVIGEYGELAKHLQPDFGDAGWVANRFAELLPLSRDVQQRLLETDDPAARLEALAPMIDAR
jgi:Lon protease-like protein